MTSRKVSWAHLAPSGIPLQLVWRNLELLGYEGHNGLRSGGQVVGAEVEVAERTQLQGEPQTVGSCGGPRKLGAVCLGEGEERDQVGVDNLRWKAIEPLAFRLAEEPDGHDDLLLRGSAWMIRAKVGSGFWKL
jgi:hypothetical protein